MPSRVRALGHPIHPALATFPLGLFSTGVIFDIVRAITGNSTFSQVGFWTITAGLVGAILAAITGFADWTAIPVGTRAKAIGRLHGRLNAVVILVFLISWALRLTRPSHVAGLGTLLLQIAALVLVAYTAWLGGELADRLGIGTGQASEPSATPPR